MHYDLGYNDKNVAIVKTGYIMGDMLASFKAELLKNPSIKGVTADDGGRWRTRRAVRPDPYRDAAMGPAGAGAGDQAVNTLPGRMSARAGAALNRPGYRRS